MHWFMNVYVKNLENPLHDFEPRDFNVITVRYMTLWVPRLPISEVPTKVKTNIVIAPYQTVWLAYYLDFFLLYFKYRPPF